MFENFGTKVVRNFQSNSYDLNSNFVILQISKKEIKLFNIYCIDPIFYEIAHYFYLISLFAELDPKECFQWNGKWWKGHAPSYPVQTECGLYHCVVCPYKKYR